MNNSRVPFSKTQEQNQETLKGIVTQIENLEEKIPDLNKQVKCRNAGRWCLVFIRQIYSN
jgi:hypothetical protein